MKIVIASLYKKIAPVIQTEDELPGAGKDFYRDDTDANAYSIPASQNIQWLASPFRDDEISWPLSSPYWRDDTDVNAYSIPASQSVPWLPAPYRDDEIGSSFANFHLEQEEPWSGQVQYSPWLAKPFADDETNPQNFWLEDERAWTTGVVQSPWIATRQADDDSFAQARILFEQDDAWLGAQEYQPWLSLQFRDDEISTSLKNFGLDDEFNVAYLSVNWPTILLGSFNPDDVGVKSLPPPLVTSSPQFKYRIQDIGINIGDISG